MKVLVNARFFGAPFRQAKFRFLLEKLLRLGDSTSLDSIYIITDLADAEMLISKCEVPWKGKIHCTIVPELRPTYWSLTFWFDFRLKSLFKKLKADVILHGDQFGSLTISGPQILTSDAILKQHFTKLPAFHRWMLLKRWPEMVAKAKGIISWSDHNSQALSASFPEITPRIFSFPLTPLSFIAPISWEGKQQVLKDRSQGVEYFLAIVEGDASSEQFMDLLKGFSWFKKRFQSNMKLLVCGPKKSKDLESVPLESYKYRNDVILSDSGRYLELLPASYALVYMPSGNHIPLPITEAFQSGVPVMAVQDPISREIAEDAVAWNSHPDPENWGKLMGELYKDEMFRKQLINKGYEKSEKMMIDTRQDSFKMTIRTFAAL